LNRTRSILGIVAGVAVVPAAYLAFAIATSGRGEPVRPGS
jgi:hypothetical protein